MVPRQIPAFITGFGLEEHAIKTVEMTITVNNLIIFDFEIRRTVQNKEMFIVMALS
jgi:hypothetical protein